MENKIKTKIGFMGAGNMARAICEGMVQKGLIDYSEIVISAPSKTTRESWKKLGAQVHESNEPILFREDIPIVFLAVKPHILTVAMDEAFNRRNLVKDTKNSKLFVSILAGVTIETLSSVLFKYFNRFRIIRVMPNTPMMVGEGCTVYCPATSASDMDILTVEKLLSSTGKCIRVTENLINGVGALAGSGPAFIYLVIEAMADAGVKMGLPRKMAIEMAAQTVLGAGKMVRDTGKHPGVLKDEVCSPGGSTITGIHELEKGAVRSAFMNAIETAAKKSLELGNINKTNNN